MIKKTVKMASSEIEVINKTSEIELSPGVVVHLKAPIEINDEDLKKLRKAWAEIVMKNIVTGETVSDEEPKED
jgi:hypothetical protein